MSAKLLNLMLSRSHSSVDWGFQLGTTTALPSLHVQHVDTESLAAQHLDIGDRVVEIEGVDTALLSVAELQDILVGARNQLELLVIKKSCPSYPSTSLTKGIPKENREHVSPKESTTDGELRTKQFQSFTRSRSESSIKNSSLTGQTSSSQSSSTYSSSSSVNQPHLCNDNNDFSASKRLLENEGRSRSSSSSKIDSPNSARGEMHYSSTNITKTPIPSEPWAQLSTKLADQVPSLAKDVPPPIPPRLSSKVERPKERSPTPYAAVHQTPYRPVFVPTNFNRGTKGLESSQPNTSVEEKVNNENQSDMKDHLKKNHLVSQNEEIYSTGGISGNDCLEYSSHSSYSTDGGEITLKTHKEISTRSSVSPIEILNSSTDCFCPSVNSDANSRNIHESDYSMNQVKSFPGNPFSTEVTENHSSNKYSSLYYSDNTKLTEEKITEESRTQGNNWPFNLGEACAQEDLFLRKHQECLKFPSDNVVYENTPTLMTFKSKGNSEKSSFPQCSSSKSKNDQPDMRASSSSRSVSNENIFKSIISSENQPFRTISLSPPSFSTKEYHNTDETEVKNFRIENRPDYSQSFIFNNLVDRNNKNKRVDPREEKRKFWEDRHKTESVRRFKWGDSIRPNRSIAESLLSGSVENLSCAGLDGLKRPTLRPFMGTARARSCEPENPTEQVKTGECTNPFLDRSLSDSDIFPDLERMLDDAARGQSRESFNRRLGAFQQRPASVSRHAREIINHHLQRARSWDRERERATTAADRHSEDRACSCTNTILTNIATPNSNRATPNREQEYCSYGQVETAGRSTPAGFYDNLSNSADYLELQTVTTSKDYRNVPDSEFKSVVRQNQVTGGNPGPPPPPGCTGVIPSMRIPTEVGGWKEPPAAIQNAMMTKDKKPFTYTPGGLDLNEIRSPRMAKRISQNAHTDDSCSQPAPIAPQHSPIQLNQLPPAALAAMHPQIAVAVLPPGGFPAQKSPMEAQTPPPPPPMPSGPVPPPPPPMPSNGLPTVRPATAATPSDQKKPLGPSGRPPPDYLADIPNATLKRVNHYPKSHHDPGTNNFPQIQLRHTGLQGKLVNAEDEKSTEPTNEERQSPPRELPKPVSPTQSPMSPPPRQESPKPTPPTPPPVQPTPQQQAREQFKAPGAGITMPEAQQPPKQTPPSPANLKQAPAPWMTAQRTPQKEVPPWAARTNSVEETPRTSGTKSVVPPSPKPPTPQQSSPVPQFQRPSAAQFQQGSNSPPSPVSPQTPQYQRPQQPQFQRPVPPPQYQKPPPAQHQPQTPHYQQPQTPQYQQPQTPQYQPSPTPQYQNPQAPQYQQPSPQKPQFQVRPQTPQGGQQRMQYQQGPAQTPQYQQVPQTAYSNFPGPTIGGAMFHIQPVFQMGPQRMQETNARSSPSAQPSGVTRIIPIQVEGRDDPVVSQNGTVNGQPRNVEASHNNDGRPQMQTQRSWTPTGSAPVQSRSFRVLQKITGSGPDEQTDNSNVNYAELPAYAMPSYPQQRVVSPYDNCKPGESEY